MAEEKNKRQAKPKSVFDARQAPHNIDAERSLLCCMMLDSNIAVDVLQNLKPQHFFAEANAHIFEAMDNIMSKAGIDNIIDIVTLTDELEKKDLLKDIGGIQYLSELSTYTPLTDNYKSYVKIIRDKALLRKIIETCSFAVSQAYENDDSEALLSKTEGLLYDISRQEERNELKNIASITPEVLSMLDDLKDPNYRLGVPTGFNSIDRILNGLHPSDLILLAARPSVGKTALAMNILANIIFNKNRKAREDKPKLSCAVFSLEMSREQLVQRLLCSVAQVSMSKASRGELDASEWKKIMAANKQLNDTQLYIDDTSYIRPQEILNKCLRLRKERGLDVIMIDYLQLITPNKDRNDSRNQEVADITRFLKIAAKELKVPILLLSQLSRKTEERKGRPQLSDLRESGAIEQDADIVMFLHKEKTEYEELNQDQPQKVEIIVAKHRNGRQGIASLVFNGPQVRFYDDEESE